MTAPAAHVSEKRPDEPQHVDAAYIGLITLFHTPAMEECNYVCERGVVCGAARTTNWISRRLACDTI